MSSEVKEGLVLRAVMTIMLLTLLMMCYHCSVQYEYKNGIYMPPIEKE